jgi:hypothetical protein
MFLFLFKVPLLPRPPIITKDSQDDKEKSYLHINLINGWKSRVIVYTLCT